MMAQLINQTSSKKIATNLEVAKTFRARGKGLLGRKSLLSGEGLWIYRCNSIHTFFMKFAIDCIFLDKKLKVTAVVKDVKPWRLVLPQWGASSVVELPSGSIDQHEVKVGDQLYVGT